MTFTSTPPTTPGFYAWKPSEESQICGALVVRDSDGKLSCTVTGVWGNWLRDPTERGGLWSRLVPSDEFENVYREGWSCGASEVDASASVRRVAMELDWDNSRAKRVMEGLE